MNINTYDNRIRSPKEVNNGPVLVETAGYIKHSDRIKELLKAGERLDAERGQYQFSSEEKIDESMSADRTMAPDYDLAEATQAKLALDKKIAAAMANPMKKGGEPERVQDTTPKEPENAQDPSDKA